MLAKKLTEPTGKPVKVYHWGSKGSSVDARGFTLENKYYDPYSKIEYERKPYIPRPRPIWEMFRG